MKYLKAVFRGFSVKVVVGSVYKPVTLEHKAPVCEGQVPYQLRHCEAIGRASGLRLFQDDVASNAL